MSHPRPQRQAGALPQPLSTVEILSAAPLPAHYLNHFSAEAPVTEIGLCGNREIQVNDEFIPFVDPLQVLVFNSLAMGVGRFVSSQQLITFFKGNQETVSKKRLTVPFLDFISELNKAAGKEVIASKNYSGVTYRLKPVRFVQKKESQNELFERLTEAGRQKFGQRVLYVISGNNDKSDLSITAPPSDLHDSNFAQDEAVPNWRLLAACRAVDSEQFFPKNKNQETQRPARIICSNCTVRPDCLSYALEHEIPHGIWGGLSERERRELKKTLKHSR